MRRVAATFGVLSLLAIAASFTLVSTELSAEQKPLATTAKSATFLIPSNDGYGIADCISSKNACGKQVAESWCQTKGYKTALSFGQAERSDFTGSVPPQSNGSREVMPLVVTCGR